jgi:hypothetical protein
MLSKIAMTGGVTEDENTLPLSSPDLNGVAFVNAISQAKTHD